MRWAEKGDARTFKNRRGCGWSAARAAYVQMENRRDGREDYVHVRGWASPARTTMKKG